MERRTHDENTKKSSYSILAHGSTEWELYWLLVSTFVIEIARDAQVGERERERGLFFVLIAL